MTAAMQGLQEEMRVLQETVGNIGTEVQWVAQGGEGVQSSESAGGGGGHMGQDR